MRMTLPITADLGGIVTVHQGERLMQKHPPTPGEAGENVLGQVIPAKPGKEGHVLPPSSRAPWSIRKTPPS